MHTQEPVTLSELGTALAAFGISVRAGHTLNFTRKRSARNAYPILGPGRMDHGHPVHQARWPNGALAAELRLLPDGRVAVHEPYDIHPYGNPRAPDWTPIFEDALTALVCLRALRSQFWVPEELDCLLDAIDGAAHIGKEIPFVTDYDLYFDRQELLA